MRCNLLAQQDDRVIIRYGAEHRDHYGRWLAHLYLPDKTSLTARLPRMGVATHFVVPPNTLASVCYRRAEEQASADIWRLPQYQVIATTELEPDARDFRRVRGRIERVGFSRSSVWLNLGGGVATAHQARRPWQFSAVGLLRAGRTTDDCTRLGLYEHDGELRMQIRHPAALEAVR